MFVHIDLRALKHWIDWKAEITWGKLASKEEIADAKEHVQESEEREYSTDGRDHVKTNKLPGGPIGFQPPELSVLPESNKDDRVQGQRDVRPALRPGQVRP